MKRFISAVLTLLMCLSLTVFVQAADNGQTLVMTIGSPAMTVDGTEAEVDPGRGTTPIIRNDRTILPVRAVVEALGGEVEWEDNTQTATLTYADNKIELVIDSKTALLNGEKHELDVTPIIINDRTYLPIRFIAEGFGWKVDWNEQSRQVTITKQAEDIYIGTNEFDLEKATVLLNNGIEMPIFGIGTFALSTEQAENSVYWALSNGYTLIDTANAYNNETGVAKGIKRAIDEGKVKREDFFLTAKIWPDNYNDAGIDQTLENLGVDYVDLMLLHQPFGDYKEGWKAMERALADGKVRAIGLSNFEQDALWEEILGVATVYPAVDQVETHPYYQQTRLMNYMDKYGTVIEAWYPLGGRGNTQVLFNDPTIMEIAQAHGKSSAQIILRWHLQAGHIAIPGSSNEEHIKENINIFDFELTDEEMEKMTALDKNERFFNLPGGTTTDELENIIRETEAEYVN